MIICLAGFSGSGKSTLLQSLSNQAPTGWNFNDLDDLVFAQMKSESCPAAMSLGEAINYVGLEKFRCDELIVLKQALESAQSQNSVLALGGGTLGRGLSFIKKSADTYLVGLDVDFETCWSRISKDANRPLTSLGKESMSEKFTRRRTSLLEADLILEQSELRSPPSLQALIEKLKGH